jgi:hypothetical protein
MMLPPQGDFTLCARPAGDRAPLARYTGGNDGHRQHSAAAIRPYHLVSGGATPLIPNEQGPPGENLKDL